MKCSEAEERIHLYRELSRHEQEETDLHLATCLSCREIMGRVGRMHKTISLQRMDIPPMTNEAQMTRRVMDAVEGIQKKKARTWGILSQNPITALRYSMAALSVFLLVFFIGEYNDDGSLMVVKRYPRTAGTEIEMNLASFHSAFFSAKENKRAPASMISECVYNCLQSQLPECNDCSNKFAKP